MTEIWVPYGPVEVSFDIKQENLSQILEPQPSRLGQEELEKNADLVSENTLLLLAGTAGAQKVLDVILTRNKSVRKIIHPKNLGALARRKSQEFGVEVEQLNVESKTDAGLVDGAPASLPTQIMGSNQVLALTSVHLDPLYGLTSVASDVVSVMSELKNQAFKRSVDELPCSPGKSNASMYSTSVVQSCAGLKAFEIIEKASTGLISSFYGDVESVHARVVDYWTKNLAIQLPIKSERVIFGCGGQDNDRTFSDALARSFFQIATNVSLPDSESRICMLAECSQGLGSEALLRYVTGRFEPRSTLDNANYFDGLEVLLSFYKVQRDFQLVILTTLPKFYVSKFDFKALSGAREAPSSIVQPGSRAKILVVPDASSSYFLST